MTAHSTVWGRYEQGREHHRVSGVYTKADRCRRFYRGDQWHGLCSDGEELPSLNFIRPIGKYKISMLTQKRMNIVYSPTDQDPRTGQVCGMLNRFAKRQWEKSGMENLLWQTLKEGFITGCHYLYCFDGRVPTGGVVLDRRPDLQMQPVYGENLYLADESNPRLEEQAWIILEERLPVEQVRRMALENGVSRKDAEGIRPDGVGDRDSCVSILYMEKTAEGLSFLRAVRELVYQPAQTVRGLHRYPLVGFSWERIPFSARGQSGVAPLIPNQLEVNKTLARRAIAVKRMGYPTLVYNADRIQNVEELGKVGVNIAVNDMESHDIRTLVNYLEPAPVSADADLLMRELIEESRSLEGAGVGATGDIDPTKASGEAIKAVRDQAAVMLREQQAGYRRLIEDIARLWLALLDAYSPYGLRLEGEILPAGTLRSLPVEIRVEEIQADPFSQLAQEEALRRLLAEGHITFSEYVSVLDSGSSVPKGKLQQILAQREKNGQ